MNITREDFKREAELLRGDGSLAPYLNRIETDLSGGRTDDGLLIARKILHKVKQKHPLSHALIIEGELVKNNDEKIVKASLINMNIGLSEGFDINLHDVYATNVSPRTITLGSTGLYAYLEALIRPNMELTTAELEGLTRTMPQALSGGNDNGNAGVLCLPQFAIRASLVGVPINDTERPWPPVEY